MVGNSRNSYYRRNNYRYRRYARRSFWRYNTGASNYYKTRVDCLGIVRFDPTVASVAKIRFGDVDSTSWSIRDLLQKASQWDGLSAMFSERKLRGIKITTTPANSAEVTVPNTICIGYCHSTPDSFEALNNNNNSMIIKIDQQTSKYVPVINDWIDNQYTTDGQLSIKSITESSQTNYPRMYSLKISMYLTLRNVKV